MTKTFRQPLLLGAVLLLAGCGFHPLYGGADGTAVQQRLSGISVDIIPDRPGQLLRQALQDQFGDDSDNPTPYKLSVSYGIGSNGEGIQPVNNATTYVRLVAQASWTLRRIGPPETIVAQGVARAIDGYDVLDTQYFAADLANRDADRRLADAIANQITADLAAQFSAQPPVPP